METIPGNRKPTETMEILYYWRDGHSTYGGERQIHGGFFLPPMAFLDLLEYGVEFWLDVKRASHR